MAQSLCFIPPCSGYSEIHFRKIGVMEEMVASFLPFLFLFCTFAK